MSRRLDRRTAVQRDGGRRELRGLALAIEHGLDRDRPQRGRVGVEAEDDLATPLLYERGQPVCKRENASDRTAGGLPAG
jgi:hypothetical protein